MQWIITGVFFVLHAIVHLLYLGQSRQIFELKPGLAWPAGSWAFSRLLGDVAIHQVGTVLLALAAAGFVISGVGVIFRLDWWQPATVASCIFSSAVFFLLWNGKQANLSEQGLVGILINAAILVVVLVLKWPRS